jgi:hypothetical protein
MFQPNRAIFRELCTVKSNLKTNAVCIKYYGQCRLVKKLKCYIIVIEETLDPVVYCGCRLPAPCLSNDPQQDQSLALKYNKI